MKSILLFTDWYLPGFRAGGPIQSCANLISHLKHHYKFYIITSAYDYGVAEPYADTQLDQWVKIHDNVSICYLSKAKQKIGFINQICNSADFDVIYLNSMFSWNFTIMPLIALRRELKFKKVVLAPRGMLSPGALSLKSIKKQVFIALFKFLNLPEKIFFQATSEQESQDIKHVFGQEQNVLIASNLPGNIQHNSFIKKNDSRYFKFVSVSRLSQEKNVNYILDVLQNIKQNIILHVYGSLKNEDYVNQFKNKAAFLPKNIQVELKGEVSNNEVNERLSDYHFFILPTLGENHGHAIYEAMNAGLPVIISDKTPWRNLEVNNAGWDLPLNDKNKWVALINKVTEMDSEVYKLWSEGAAEFAKKRINSEEIKAQYISLFS